MPDHSKIAALHAETAKEMITGADGSDSAVDHTFVTQAATFEMLTAVYHQLAAITKLIERDT